MACRERCISFARTLCQIRNPLFARHTHHMTPPLYSFNTPCLRWKLLIAYKGQNGWPGFLFPNATRYLAIIITVTNDPSGLYRFDTGEPLGLPITTNAYPAAIDRITGRPLPGGTPGLV